MTFEDNIIILILSLILASILYLGINIYNKKYTFNLSEFTDILLSCGILGTAAGACYVLLHYSIYGELLTESTSPLTIRLFSMFGAFYLIFKALDAYIKKINEYV